MKRALNTSLPHFTHAAVMLLVCCLCGCEKPAQQSSQVQKRQAEATQTTKTVKTVVSTNMDLVTDVAWAFHGGTEAEGRFSKLNDINLKNIKDLSLAWYLDLPEGRGQEATPLVVDGVMYTTAAFSHVFAIDAVSGKQLWHFDPKVEKAAQAKGCCGPVNRGVAYADGKVFLGAFDGRLIGLDAKTGEQLWSTQTVDTTKNYTITGAPRVANGKVFIGNGGAEFGVRGYVSAYDQNSGELAWRFYTVPGHPDQPHENPIFETAAKTWSGEYWKLGGGGTVWDSMAYDAELNLLYIGVGNSSPWNPQMRTNGEGDNLFVSSIVALNADTGRYVWHYQTTPQDAWDYTATQHMILTDLVINDEPRSVIMQAPKNGFFYVLDRKTGEFISAENFVPVNWASHIDENGRPVVNQEAKYWENGTPSLVTPAWSGGHNWHPMSYSEKTGLVYFPAQEMAFPYMADQNPSAKQLAVNLGVDTLVASFPDDQNVVAAIKEATKGHLAAWDPVAQKEVWRVQYPGAWNGGVLSTAGDLVFQGSAVGYLNAYNANDGSKLWEFPAQTGIVAPPVTYRINGEQYITVSAGWGGIFPLMTGPLTRDSTETPVNRSRLLTFKLGGTATLPEEKFNTYDLPDMTDIELDPEKVVAGLAIYERYCAQCHGTGAYSGGVVADLRFSATLADAATWRSIVADGAMRELGMIGFGDELSNDEVENIRQFVIGRNQYARSHGEVSRVGK